MFDITRGRGTCKNLSALTRFLYIEVHWGLPRKLVQPSHLHLFTRLKTTYAANECTPWWCILFWPEERTKTSPCNIPVMKLYPVFLFSLPSDYLASTIRGRIICCFQVTFCDFYTKPAYYQFELLFLNSFFIFFINFLMLFIIVISSL